MKHRWIWLYAGVALWLFVSTLGGVACGPGETKPKGECQGALDCPGSQLCIDNKCVSVGETGGGKEGTTDGASEVQTEPTTEPTTEPATETTEPASETSAEPTRDGGEPRPEEPVSEPFIPDAGPQCIDKDNDGYCENIPGDRGAKDCDDNNKEVYPTAAEVCNGIDDNCDGNIDEDLTPPPCIKDKGVCQGALKTCDGKNGWKDCDAAAYEKHNSAYQATESSCDGEDNDCDGDIDESFAEKDKACTDSTKKGECSRGKYQCQSGKLTCVATTRPTTETCNNGKDEDCDGQVDENPPCSCTPGKTEACYPGTQGCTGSNGNYNCTAPCRAGKRTCGSNYQWGACVGAVVATKELCDGKDNNCDGKVDETFTTLGRICIVGTGECRRIGKIVCSGTTSTRCNATAGRPTTEVCDGKDNDCDGKIDDGLRVGTYYQDLDKDGYGNPSVSKTNCARPTGYVTNNTDCYDKNPNARPGQTGWFTTHRGDGSFDYNCDKRLTRRPLTCSKSCTGREWASATIACGKAAPTRECRMIGLCTKRLSGNITTPCH